MTRLPRYLVAGQPQHIIQRGNNRQAIFLDEPDHRVYLDLLKTAGDSHALAVHAYVLMTNHVHLLATPASEHSLPKTMQKVGGHYARYFNARHGRSGGLWDGRYRATPVDSERYLLACLRYIELNPVRAGLVSQPASYRWSSCAHHTRDKADGLVSEHALYRDLGDTPGARQAAYRALLAEGLAAPLLDEIRQTVHKGWVLGGQRFKDEVETLSGRRTRPARRGRPTKSEN